ncbi:Gfo/Idh/MocA family protein [Brachybacterium saurashtrense]|uniref:Gfo/Idh/MocA family oxidoreductase n=1 Tax=Brachybacterium saurashtrense TaxID=556288 RepID=A0A345YP09_9MICO|nr:Gfo/Idh/MocA family oxidoreductase [Brachybacterium saurashtrense]AXK45661.1 gfo/Idh/MocA family oxidoreductase [Brachybacterium saurashtrense]RRR24678.1 gfo/Idh/MocA family oxidoreductase [Brachybacterium saurashtrense]
MSEKTVRLGIIGYGAQGGMYAGVISDGKVEGMSLGAIADTDPAKKELAAEKHPDVPFYDDYLAMLDSGDVDAVVTTVPHYLHPEMTITALGKGIHTLTEKPAGVYTKQVEEMNAFAAAHPETTFAIMFNQRTNPVYTDLKALIDSGELGALRHTSWIITSWWRPQGYYDQSAWRATWGGEGGGVLVNQAPHQLDLWQWLAGAPKKVFAKLAFGFRRDIATEDEVNALVDFGDGVTGHFMTSTNDVIGTDRLELLFDKGKVVVDKSTKVTVYRLSEDERVLSEKMTMQEVSQLFRGELDPSTLYTVEEKEYESAWGVQHIEVLTNFAAHVNHGTPLIADGAEGLNGVRLASGMQLSAWTGREIDLVDYPAEEYLAELNARIEEEGTFPTRS